MPVPSVDEIVGAVANSAADLLATGSDGAAAVADSLVGSLSTLLPGADAADWSELLDSLTPAQVDSFASLAAYLNEVASTVAAIDTARLAMAPGTPPNTPPGAMPSNVVDVVGQAWALLQAGVSVFAQFRASFDDSALVAEIDAALRQHCPPLAVALGVGDAT